MKNRSAFWVVLLVILVVMCCCSALIAGSLVLGGVNWGLFNNLGIGRDEITAQFSQTLDVRGPISLSVDVPVGDITISAGASDRVIVDATKRAWGTTRARAEDVLSGIAISAKLVGSEVQVRATGLSGSSRTPRSPQVDLLISVPKETSVTVDSTVGRLSLTGTRGDVAIHSDVGEVRLTDVAPIARAEVQTRVANIEVTGALSPQATYEISSDVGRIAVRLPSSSAFSIDARSDIGDVDVQFTVKGVDSRESIVGKEVRGTVGGESGTQLHLTSRIGEISVRPGQ